VGASISLNPMDLHRLSQRKLMSYQYFSASIKPITARIFLGVNLYLRDNAIEVMLMPSSFNRERIPARTRSVCCVCVCVSVCVCVCVYMGCAEGTCTNCMIQQAISYRSLTTNHTVYIKTPRDFVFLIRGKVLVFRWDFLR
jgi:hypothetical protein